MFHHSIIFLTAVTLAVLALTGPFGVDNNTARHRNGVASACIGDGDSWSNEIQMIKRKEGETKGSHWASATTTMVEEERNYSSSSPIPHARQRHTLSTEGKNRKNHIQHRPVSHPHDNQLYVAQEDSLMMRKLHRNSSIRKACENMSSSAPPSPPPSTSQEAATTATIVVCPAAEVQSLKVDQPEEGASSSSSAHYFSSRPSFEPNVVEVEDLSNDYPSSRDKGPDGKYCGSFSLGVVRGEVFARQSNASFDFHMEGFHQNVTCQGEAYEYNSRTHHADVPGSRDPDNCLGSLLTGANVTLDVLYYPKTDQLKLDFGFTYVKCRKCEP